MGYIHHNCSTSSVFRQTPLIPHEFMCEEQYANNYSFSDEGLEAFFFFNEKMFGSQLKLNQMGRKFFYCKNTKKIKD